MDESQRIQDRYVLDRPAGRGGMAEVWLATDERLDRPVAVKFLSPHLTEDPEFLVRFFSEAQTVAGVSHPNVVRVLDFGRHDGRPYLVMEYLPGGAIGELIGEPVVAERAFEIVEEAAHGAAAAHGVGLVHRDIKPGNILLDVTGRAKLADFGISFSSNGEHLTQTGTTIGSPHYISPEQVAGRSATERSDVYSLGIVLYELLTGRKPIDADNVTAVAIAQVDHIPQPPSDLNPDLTPEIDGIVMRCLAKDPTERYDGAEELAGALAAYRTGVPATSALAEGGVALSDTGEDESLTGRNRPSLVGVAIAGLLLLAAGTAVVAGGNPAAPARNGGSAPIEQPEVDLTFSDESPTPSAHPAADTAAGSGGSTERSKDEPKDEPQKEEEEEPSEEPAAGAGDAPEETSSPSPEPSPTDEANPEPTTSSDSETADGAEGSPAP